MGADVGRSRGGTRAARYVQHGSRELECTTLLAAYHAIIAYFPENFERWRDGTYNEEVGGHSEVFVDVVQGVHPAVMPTTNPVLYVSYQARLKRWAHTQPGHAMPGRYAYMGGTSANTAFRRTVLCDCELGAEEGSRLTQAAAAMFAAHPHKSHWKVAGT